MCKGRWLGTALALVLASPLFVFPLSWLPRSWAHFRYDVTVPLPEIVLAASLILGGGTLLRKAIRRDRTTNFPGVLFVANRAIMPVAAVFVSAVVSTRFSEHSYLGIGLLPRLFGSGVIFLFAASLSRKWAFSSRQLWIPVAFLVAMNGLVRLKFEPEFLSTFGNWDFLGAYLAASLVVGSFAGGVLSFVGNGVSIVAMLFCRSRGAWLALGAVALLWFVFFGGKILRRWQARAITVVLAPIIASLLAWPYIRKQWQLDVRPVIWKATIAMIIDRPVLGHGLGTYVAVYPRYRLPQYFLRPKSTNVTDHAHDELLEIAAEQGLVGFLATLWLWATAVWCGVSAVRQSSGLERRAVLGLLGAALVFMLHGLVDVDLRYLPNQSLLWLLMGLLVGRTATPPGGTYGSSVSRTAQWMLVAVCLALGCWIVVSAIIRPMEADWLDRKARLAREQGEMSATAEYAFRALSLEPFRLSTRYLLAGVLARSPNPSTRQLAIDQCLHIEEFAPDYADVTYNLGELYMAANQVTNAIPYLRRAVEINPYRADRHLALAVALRSTGRNEEAITQLDLAEKLQPGNEAIRAIRRDIQGNP